MIEEYQFFKKDDKFSTLVFLLYYSFFFLFRDFPRCWNRETEICRYKVFIHSQKNIFGETKIKKIYWYAKIPIDICKLQSISCRWTV